MTVFCSEANESLLMRHSLPLPAPVRPTETVVEMQTSAVISL